MRRVNKSDRLNTMLQRRTAHIVIYIISKPQQFFAMKTGVVHSAAKLLKDIAYIITMETFFHLHTLQLHGQWVDWFHKGLKA